MSDTTGLTKDAGWQVGVRRTIPGADAGEVWRFLTSSAGTRLWLGDGVILGDRGGTWEAADGTGGEIRSRREHDRIRVTMSQSGGHETTVQMTVRATARGATIGFHEERMQSVAERTERKAHWERVHETIRDAVIGSRP